MPISETIPIALIHDTDSAPGDLVRQFGPLFDVEAFHFDAWQDTATVSQDAVVFHFTYEDAQDLDWLSQWFQLATWRPTTVLAGSASLRAKLAQRGLTRNTSFIARPFESAEVYSVLAPVRRQHAARVEAQRVWRGRRARMPVPVAEGIAVCDAALDGLFAAARGRGALDVSALRTSAETLVEGVRASALDDWISAVREHHDSTYQHCLLVTGVASAYAESIGLSQTDQRRMTSAALLHDIGKARVPLAILDKPAALSADEWTLMRAHPTLGADSLSHQNGLDSDLLHAVRHHHEYLDGSGYPDGLTGHQIGDLTRMLTIADIFAALLERRAYKPPMSGPDAYKILCDMGSKLEQPLVGAFRPVAVRL